MKNEEYNGLSPVHEDAVSKMVAKLVHKLRNPLSSIKMGLTTLLHRASLNEKDEHCLEVVVREVVQIENILKDLLGFVQPYVLHFSEQNINHVLEMSLEEPSKTFNEKGIAVQKKFSKDLPRIVLDVGRMSRAIGCLLQNSQDALVAGGIIKVHSSLDQDKKTIVVEVMDNGIGISEEVLEHVFEPFFSTRTGRTGLGLTIVKKVVEAHGGTVNVESTLGKGTTVRMHLPTD
jgi:two-component system sensor histidine kinase HydH